MKLEQKQIKNVRQATLLSIIPGLGQFYNKQNFKGIVFFALFALFIIEFFAVGLNALIYSCDTWICARCGPFLILND